MHRRTLALVCAIAFRLHAQSPADLLNDSAVRAAMDAAARNEPAILQLQAHICEIPAPPFHEEARARELKRLFEEAHLQDVRIDKTGNVIGVRPGKAAHPNLVFSAHLDTVFPEGTDVHVTRTGDVMKGPGIGDDCRGLAVMLAVIRALDEGHVETPGTITFVADVGEEGLGDLRGMKGLFFESLKGQIDKFISVDGTGLGITHIGVGSNRYKVVFKGPGGHSYGAFGMVNPIQAMGRAIAKIDAFTVPSHPKTTFNVGRVGGGTSVNAVPFEAWMEVDMRSADPAALKALDDKFQAAIKEAVAEENARWKGKAVITASAELVGVRPAGQTARESPIVQTALAVSRAMKIEEVLREGSTDSNVPMNLGIPAITISGGGQGTGAHALTEAFDAHDSVRGTQRAILLAISLAR
jgi:acetylornithine deacetylase/succinyl-diaminopimelate desuccinylase-like protein